MHTQLDGPLPVVEQIVRSVKAARIAAPGAAVVITATTSESTGFSPTTNGPHYAPFIFVDTTFVAGDLTQVKRLPILHGRWISQEHTIPVEIVINEAAQGLLGVVGGTPSCHLGQDHRQSPRSRLVSLLTVKAHRRFTFRFLPC